MVYIKFGTLKIAFLSTTLHHMAVALRSQYLLVIGAKLFLAKQYIK